MKKPNITFFDLVSIVNDATEQTSDIIIAKALIENRYQLDDLSLDQLSDKYYLSQASISRFIKKMGFKSYMQFKRELAFSIYDIQTLHPQTSKQKTSVVIEETYQDIVGTLEFFKSIDSHSLEQLLKYFHQYQNIYFFGSKLSISIVHLLQQVLLHQKKNVYTLYDIHYQKETLHHLKDTDLVICLSLEGRWLHFIHEDLKQTRAIKLLWTPKNSDYQRSVFQDVFYLGENIDNNLGYHNLMYFVLLVYKLLLNHSNIE